MSDLSFLLVISRKPHSFSASLPAKLRYNYSVFVCNAAPCVCLTQVNSAVAEPATAHTVSVMTARCCGFLFQPVHWWEKKERKKKRKKGKTNNSIEALMQSDVIQRGGSPGSPGSPVSRESFSWENGPGPFKKRKKDPCPSKAQGDRGIPPQDHWWEHTEKISHFSAAARFKTEYAHIGCVLLCKCVCVCERERS